MSGLLYPGRESVDSVAEGKLDLRFCMLLSPF
jgi:hypothetical protein